MAGPRTDSGRMVACSDQAGGGMGAMAARPEREAGPVQAFSSLYMRAPLSAVPQPPSLPAAAAGFLGGGVAPRWLGWVALPPVLCLLVGAAGLGDLYGPLEVLGYLGGLMPFL